MDKSSDIMGDTSVKIVKHKSVRQVRTTPLDSVSHGQAYQLAPMHGDMRMKSATRADLHSNCHQKHFLPLASKTQPPRARIEPGSTACQVDTLSITLLAPSQREAYGAYHFMSDDRLGGNYGAL